MDDEDTAKRFAYEMMEAFLGRKGERSKLPGFEDLAWQEEATPPWVVAHLRLFH